MRAWLAVLSVLVHGCPEAHLDCPPTDRDAEVAPDPDSGPAPDGDAGGPPGERCLYLGANFEEGIVEDISAAVGEEESGLWIPRVILISHGFGVDNVVLETAALFGAPWDEDEMQPGARQMSLTFGGLESGTSDPVLWPTEGYDAAKALFDAMVFATETTVDSGTVRTTAEGRVRCEVRLRQVAADTFEESARCYLGGMLGASIGLTTCTSRDP